MKPPDTASVKRYPRSQSMVGTLDDSELRSDPAHNIRTIDVSAAMASHVAKNREPPSTASPLLTGKPTGTWLRLTPSSRKLKEIH